jgi:methyl-accepting chemotaxis protein
MGIDRTIRGINSKLKQAAKGDFTIRFTSKRKDEFHILTEEIQETFLNVNELIQQVKQSSSEVLESSSDLSKTSEAFLRSAENISSAMGEIEQGVNQQAKNAEECLTQMDSLSHKIELVSDSTKEIGNIADNTKKRVLEGTLTTDELNQQTSSTIAITTEIIHEIEKLATKSSSINNIINVINDIANQTNLLSLNASIEAARAGEYGKGFAVVASEIRTLAEMSKSSVSDIKKIINSIQEDTSGVVEIARKAEKVLTLQDTAVKNTTISYQDINESVEKLVVFLKYITENVDNINEARVSTLEAIESISAVLEEIAASSNNVNQVSNDQLSSVGSLNESVGKLNINADHLVRAVQKFIV